MSLRQFPSRKSFYGKFIYGSDNSFTGHAHYGNTVDTEHGRFGYLLELYYQSSDGFRSIQGMAIGIPAFSASSRCSNYFGSLIPR